MRVSLIGLLLAALFVVGCDGKTSQQRSNEKAFIAAVSSFSEQSKRGLSQFNDFPSDDSVRSIISDLDAKLSRFPEARQDKLLNQIYGECESVVSSFKQLHGYFNSVEKIGGRISKNSSISKSSVPERHRDTADFYESHLKKVGASIRNNIQRLDELLTMAQKR